MKTDRKITGAFAAVSRPGAPLPALILCGFLALLPGCGAPEPPQNLLFISLDTTRRDHLSIYGYERQTTPVLDALAAGGAVFENGVAQMTYTNPSHASMFSGLYPKTHGVGENTRELADEFLTLTEVLGAVGMRTGGFVSGHPLKSRITGIDQGFEEYDGNLRRRRDGGETTDRALEWLGGLGSDEQFFLFVHYYDAHGPFRRKPEYESLFQSEAAGQRLGYIPGYQQLTGPDGGPIQHLNAYVDRYDRLMRYQDDLVARLLDAVDLETTLVVVVADHGETFVERGDALNLNHGGAVFEEQVAIPFLFHSPAIQPGRHPQPVETVDLLPTILDLLGLGMPPGMTVEGESLLPIIEGREDPSTRHLAFSSGRARKGTPYELREKSFIHAVRSSRWKLIVYPGVDRDHLELYDLREDPGETRNIADEHPEQRDKLLQVLDEWRTSEPRLEEGEVTPEDLEDLRALGYVG